MPVSILEIKDRLKKIVDDNGSVRNMESAAEAIAVLERMTITQEELEATRLGLYVNHIRRASDRNSPLAKRAKNLIISWKKLIDKGTPARLVQQTRPETPNSVGSSPSPPEPPDFPIIRNYSSPQLVSLSSSRSSTPTSDPGSRRSKKQKATPEGKSSRKKDVPDGAVTPKGQSSEVKSEKQVLDTGQSTMSVGSNGLKLTFKTHPAVQALANQSSERGSRGGSPSSPHSLKRSQTDSNLQLPHKHHKKKKGHRSPHQVSSPALSTATERIATTRQEDAYNNNNTDHKIKNSKSSPSFTVNKTSPDKIHKAATNNVKITTPKSYNNLKSLSPDTSTLNLKRKRDQSVVDTTSPERSSENKPRAPKERRLTYDPVTGQLKQVPSQDKPDMQSTTTSSIKPTTSKKIIEKLPTKQKSPSSAIKKDSSKTLKTQNSSFSKAEKLISPPTVKTGVFSEKISFKSSVPSKKLVSTPKIVQKRTETHENEIIELNADETPTRLSPTVNILDDTASIVKRNCFDNCSTSNLYETRREFRKRKTRRKNTKTETVDIKTIFPISSAVDTVSSDSDEKSDLEDGFCKSVVVSESTDKVPTHSKNCTWPGVTGCRGNNGSWFDWTETFCVKTHEKSEPLPNEEEIMPLQILPYVELD